MTERLVKCYGDCNKKHAKSTMQQIGGKNHCLNCFNFKTKERKDREDLYHYIQDEYNLSFPTGLMLRQIKMFREERGYTYKNIRFTLEYVFHVRRVYTPQVKFGIAFVPHFYDEMITYYKELSKKRLETKVAEVKTKIITLDKPKYNTTYASNKIINMEDLLNGGIKE